MAGVERALQGDVSEEAAVKLLGLKWKKEPEPCHDYLLFLTRSPDSTQLATASSNFHLDHVTEIWNLPDRQMIYRLQTPNAQTVVMEWVQNEAFVTGGHDCHLTLWQGGQAVTRLSGHQDWLRSLAACGSTLLSGDASSMLGIWDLPSQRNRCMFLHPNHNEMEINVIMDLAFLPGSDTCFYILQRTGRLTIGDLRVRDLIQCTTLLEMIRPSKMKTTENSHQVIISARGNEIKLWDIRAIPICVQRYSQHKSESLPLGFDFLCYEKYLATGSDDGCAYIYETLTGRLVRKIKLGNGQVQSCCAESPDSLSFFTSFDNARYLGLIDTEGLDSLHEHTSTEQIKETYRKTAMDTALSKFTQRLVIQARRLTVGATFGHENWLEVLRTSEEKESKDLLADIETEYQHQLETTTPALVRDLMDFYRRTIDSQCTEKPVESAAKVPWKSSLAPTVRREIAFSYSAS